MDELPIEHIKFHGKSLDAAVAVHVDDIRLMEQRMGRIDASTETKPYTVLFIGDHHTQVSVKHTVDEVLMLIRAKRGELLREAPPA